MALCKRLKLYLIGSNVPISEYRTKCYSICITPPYSIAGLLDPKINYILRCLIFDIVYEHIKKYITKCLLFWSLFFIYSKGIVLQDIRVLQMFFLKIKQWTLV